MTTLKPVKTSQSADIQKLEATITDMHALSEQGFNQIRGIALSALAYMQTPDGYRHPETIAQTLEAIWQIADNIRDCIGNHASEAGFAYTDTDNEQRLQAFLKAKEIGTLKAQA